MRAPRPTGGYKRCGKTGRCRHRPLRMGTRSMVQDRAGRENPALRGVTRGAAKRADVGIGPYEGYKGYGARPSGRSIFPCEKFCQGGLDFLFVSELLNIAPLVAGKYMLEYLRQGGVLCFQLRVKRPEAGVAVFFQQVGHQVLRAHDLILLVVVGRALRPFLQQGQ